MKSIVVFCGSSAGHNPVYEEQATALGAALAKRGLTVIYGGARVGLMGAVANGALQNGGKVIGVIPHFLQKKELAHGSLTELILVDTMHERKTKMNELSDAVIALPGGFGTMEELFEMLTWGQLGLHQKPVAILNINGYYDGLQVMTSVMVREGFLSECVKEMLLISDSVEDIMQRMENYVPPEREKLINKQTT